MDTPNNFQLTIIELDPDFHRDDNLRIAIFNE